MEIVKKILAVVWPIVYGQLKKLAEKTATPFDDAAVLAADAAVNYWLNYEEEENDN
jgi:hypothetical protein